MEQDESSPNKDKTPKRKPTIPKARKVNFEGFKNRFSEGEDIYALDVLVAGDDLADEIHREMQTRQNFGYQNPVHSEEKNNSGRKQTKKSSSVFDQANRAAIPKAVIQPKEGGWVRRVRIQSQPIIHHLSKVVGETWDTDTPRTFDRPFSVFIYFQDKMRDVLAELESRWAEEERRQALGGESKAVEDREANTLDNKESMGARAASIEALRDVRCYVKFVDDEIAPLARQFEGTAHKKIRFDDLWFLFKVGDLVCTPGGMVPAISGSSEWRPKTDARLIASMTLTGPLQRALSCTSLSGESTALTAPWTLPSNPRWTLLGGPLWTKGWQISVSKEEDDRSLL